MTRGKASRSSIGTLTAREIMSTDVVTVEEELPVTELASTLVANRITGAPVVNKKQRLVGIVSATDLVAHELQTGRVVVSEREYYARKDIGTRAEQASLGMHEEDYADTLVRDIMTPIIISAPPDATVTQLAGIMGVNRIHRVLITDGESLLGIVSSLDLIALIPPDRLDPACL